MAGAGFVKFAIALSDPGTVYFQDSNLYPFHFDFATRRLQPFLGMSRAQFDAVSLRRAGQQVVLGAVIFPPFSSPREFGIQFVGLDPYPKEDVKAWFDAVKAAVMADPPADAIYIPSFEQKAQAEVDREWLQGRDRSPMGSSAGSFRRRFMRTVGRSADSCLCQARKSPRLIRPEP
jgi:hypothetical protein